MANNILIALLYLFEYVEDAIKRIKKYAIIELIKFVILFSFVLYCIESLILYLNIVYKIELIDAAFTFIIVGLLYIYAEQNKEEFVKRKTFCKFIYYIGLDNNFEDTPKIVTEP